MPDSLQDLTLFEEPYVVEVLTGRVDILSEWESVCEISSVNPDMVDVSGNNVRLVFVNPKVLVGLDKVLGVALGEGPSGILVDIQGQRVYTDRKNIGKHG